MCNIYFLNSCLLRDIFSIMYYSIGILMASNQNLAVLILYFFFLYHEFFVIFTLFCAE